MKTKLTVGVTGGFGTGKSTVLDMFKDLGADVISADKLCYNTTLPEGEAYKEIVSLFGSNVLKEDRTIDRKKLGDLVFSDEEKLKTLDGIIHPIVISQINDLVGKSTNKVVVMEIPLLVEVGLVNSVDKVIVVKTEFDTQIARCTKRGFRKDEAEQRARSQLPLLKKLDVADFIIDNNGSIGSTKKQVKKVWEELNYDRINREKS